MKLVAAVLAFCASEVAASGVRGAALRPRGFADANPDEDEAFKVLKKHSHHADHHLVQRSAGGSIERELQHEVEQMVSRVKHLHDREASIAFAEEITALEQEIEATLVDKALIDEVHGVRADLCTQSVFEDSTISECTTFMESSCSKRPLQVASKFCTKFFRQRKHRRSHATASDDAVKFSANNAADSSTDEAAVASKDATASTDTVDSEAAVDSKDAAENAVESEAAVDSEASVDSEAAAGNEGTQNSEGAAEAEAEQETVVQGPAPGPAPAPGPVPMGVLFGGKHVRPLPDQGFDGELDQYKDFEQQVENWQMEFGPKSGHRDYSVICAEHKGNEWCRLHGYYGRKKPKTVIEEITEVVEGEGGGGAGGAKPPGLPGIPGSAARLYPTTALMTTFVAVFALLWS